MIQPPPPPPPPLPAWKWWLIEILYQIGDFFVSLGDRLNDATNGGFSRPKK